MGIEKVGKCIEKEETVTVSTGHQERCIKQFVLTAAMNVKYHLNRKRENLFTVENVSESTGLDIER